MKLAKRGGKFNKRVIYLDNERISYFSKVPPEYVNNTFPANKNKKGEDIPCIPKVSVHLRHIITIGKISKFEFNRFKKL